MKTSRNFLAALFALVVILTAACGHRAGKSSSETAIASGTTEVPAISEAPAVSEAPAAPFYEEEIIITEMAEEIAAEPVGESAEAEITTDYSFDEYSEDIAVEAPAAMSEPMADMAVAESRSESRDSDAGEEYYEHEGRRRVRGQRPGGAGVITAGEWNDLDNWDFWRSMLQRVPYRRMPEYWNFEGIDRRPQHSTRRVRGRGRTVEVAFMVDATGSMSDELEFLKTELVDVVGRVERSNLGTNVLTGSVFYRDSGDQYVTRLSPFTRDVRITADFIRAQRADGGGDFPEAVHTALERSVWDLQWSSDARAKILFLLLDAPPHHLPYVLRSLRASVDSAVEQGIRIVPIVASGIDKETEFLMRFIAISTDGTYVFITDHSGVGGSHLDPSVGAHRVELLNDLIVRLINKYAA